ncbi:Urease accessory protein UreD [BD1-7 clade bacterium]|uniref:Urease accessory protein UreD n=1 Tax=BD1-7 clade bacterium TaxID=2029982 RepID=A0A5S9QKM1_9GAMM|nr:Urease accessory protein UreD [BD1-7 clade bacterium]
MTQALTLLPDTFDPNYSQDEWRAQLTLGFAVRQNRTLMVRKNHAGPLVVQKPIYPNPETGEVHLYLLHPPGGIVSGDKLSISAVSEQNARALLSSPGAAKFYRAKDNGMPQVQQVNLTVRDTALLEWLPHETIVFDGANGVSQLDVNLSESGCYVGWEITCLGLKHQDKPFETGSFRQRMNVWRDGRLALTDTVAVAPDNNGLHGLAALAGNGVFATLLICPAVSARENVLEQLVEQCRQIALDMDLQGNVGVTEVNGIVIARYLGERSDQCKNYFIACWKAARPMVAGLPVSAPAIWNT